MTSAKAPQEILEYGLSCMEKFSIQNPVVSEGIAGQEKKPFQWLYSKQIDWEELKAVARDEFSEVASPSLEDVCGVLDRSLMRIDDHHSLITSPHYNRYHYKPLYRNWDKTSLALSLSWKQHKAGRIEKSSSNNQDRKVSMPVPRILDGILYLDVPEFLYGITNREAYQNSLLKAQFNAAKQGVRGVIVDLRHNSGGACPPMLYGLAPVFGPGPLARYVSPRSPEGEYPLTVNYGAIQGTEIENKPENFPLSRVPVAVLSGPNTASSGETVLMCLKTRPLTAVFGEASAGYSTGNAPYQLSEDSWLQLCTGLLVDSNGRGDGGRIKTHLETDTPLEDAKLWLNNRLPSEKASRLLSLG